MSEISNSLTYKSPLLSITSEAKIQQGESAANPSIDETIRLFHNSAANNSLKLWSRQCKKTRMD